MVGVLGVVSGILAILSPVVIVFIVFSFRHLRYVRRQREISRSITENDINRLTCHCKDWLALRPFVLRECQSISAVIF